MKISPIQQKNFNQTNFNGKFESSKLLTNSLEKATDYDLKKFSELLKRMKNKNDNLLFYLKSVQNTIGGGFYKIQSIELNKLEQKKPSLNIFTVGQEIIPAEKDFTNDIFNNVIKKLNKILEEIYPEQKIIEPTRKMYLENIYKNLD